MLNILKYSEEGFFGGNKFSKIKIISDLDKEYKNKTWLNELDFNNLKVKIRGDQQAAMVTRKGKVVDDISKSIKEDFEYVKNVFNNAKKDTKEFNSYYENFFKDISKISDKSKRVETLEKEYNHAKKTPVENVIKPNHILLGNVDIKTTSSEICKSLSTVTPLSGYATSVEINIKDKNTLSDLYIFYKEMLTLLDEIEQLQENGFGSFNRESLEKNISYDQINDEDVAYWYYETFITNRSDLNSSLIFNVIQKRLKMMLNICSVLIIKTLHKV